PCQPEEVGDQARAQAVGRRVERHRLDLGAQKPQPWRVGEQHPLVLKPLAGAQRRPAGGQGQDIDRGEEVDDTWLFSQVLRPRPRGLLDYAPICTGHANSALEGTWVITTSLAALRLTSEP